MVPIELPPYVLNAFAAFVSDASLLALPLKFSPQGELEPLTAIAYPKDPGANFQAALSGLDIVVNYKTPLYLILRRDNTLTVITYVPHLATDVLKSGYLDGRHELVQKLGESYFTASLICKEAAEITDVRSWNERDMHASDCKSCPQEDSTDKPVKDLGYHKNKCRLCDRRMKNKIEEDASQALQSFNESGDLVQLVRCLSSCVGVLLTIN